MVAQSNRVLGGGAIAAAVVGLVMIAAGCSVTPSLHGNGLPSGLETVGGGPQINWKAPTDGTVYLVEKTSGKIIETQSLDKGEVFEFEIGSDDVETFEKVVGVRLTAARLVLYFKPANSKSSTP
jgi:hypothetical protein